MNTSRPSKGNVGITGAMHPASISARRVLTARTREPEQEFRIYYMIRELHKNGIACILEFYFPEETDSLMALRALQFWRFYHVDGFSCNRRGL